MYIVFRIVSVGAAALAGILPITAAEPQVLNPISAVISQSATQPASIGGTACKKVGQIRDFQSQRLICLRVNAKAGSSKGSSLVWVKISSPKNSTKPTSTTTAETTTSVPRICQEGSVCKVGDRGPGGGLVFYVNQDKTSTDWKYLELAPTSMSSEWYKASAAADAYKTATKDDWFLPTYAQLVLAIENLFYLPNPPLFFNECLQGRSKCIPIWTSESSGTGWGIYGGPRMTNNKLSSDTKVDPRSMSPTPASGGLSLQVIAIRGVKSTSTSTPASTSASVTTTSTTSLTKKKLLSASYEVLDATRIKIMWNFISSVREYRICVGDLCSGPNPQWLTISPTENSKILDLPLGQSQNYYVHALLLNDAKEYDSIDTRPCCIGTKWADGVTVSAKNNFSP